MGVYKVAVLCLFGSALYSHAPKVGDSCSGDEVVIKEPYGEHKYSVVYLHGYTEGEDSVKGFADALLKNSAESPELLHTKFIMPLANKLKVKGGVVRGWAAVPDEVTASEPEDEENFRKSAERVQQCIINENKIGIPPENIVVGGFSQGGAVAYLCGLEFQKRLAGIFAISSWVPLMLRPDGTPKQPIELQQPYRTPILHCHGKNDELILPEWAKMSVEHLRDRFGLTVEMQEFDGGHELCTQSIGSVAKFLHRVMKAKGVGASDAQRNRRSSSDLGSPSRNRKSSVT